MISAGGINEEKCVLQCQSVSDIVDDYIAMNKMFVVKYATSIVLL